jgi:putative DNA methylase
VTPYRKKLIEVALPLAKINEAAAREKSIRHGHPSTLHLWWARRPLAACRAVLFASLVDDPDSDPDFKFDENVAATKRAKLFNLIEELVQWENSNNPRVINAARAEIARCVASRKLELKELKPDDKIGNATVLDIKGMLAQPADVNAFLAEHAPPVLDPFCGGGSIPLEAQRLGLRAYASDLNPVPVLITKALIEIPPKFAGRPPVNPDWQKKSKEEKAATIWHGAQGLAADVRYYGKWMRDEAEKRIGHLYPKVMITKEIAKDRPDLKEYIGEQLTVIAWLWVRTVECPNPSCRARMPLVRSFWLSKKKGNETFAKPILDQARKQVRFAITTTGQAPKHTTDRTGARCLFCETFVKKPQLREIATTKGVAPIPFAIVLEGDRERIYLSGDAVAATEVQKPAVPFLEQPITNDRRWFSPPLYGMPNFADLFTNRQLVALTTFCDLVQEIRDLIRKNAVGGIRVTNDSPLIEGGVGPSAYADAISTYLAFAISKASSRNCTLAVWESGTGFGRLAGALGRQALPMQWGFAETNPLSGAGGDIAGTAESVTKVLSELPNGLVGSVQQVSATAIDFPAAVSTDPPYYDNIGYADLSDFFYVWLRRCLFKTYPSLFATLLTPKAQELIVSAHRHEGSKEAAQDFFEQGLGTAFSCMQKLQKDDLPLTVYYAFKQAESDGAEGEDDMLDGIGSVSTGWETMLAGLVRAGFSVHGTWPMRTEAINALKKDIGALASSIVLVCRPRPGDAALATRKQFISALRQELPEALRNLQHGNIAPVDLAQAAIGPGMAVFTRYAKVMETDGSAMSVRTALGLINQSLDEVLAEQEGEFDGETRWALAWFEQFGMDEGPFGVAETLSKAKNTAINGLVESGIVTARAGKVRLVKRADLPDEWNPGTDASRLAIWLVTQHLIHALDQHGESAAAALLHQLGGIAEIARDLAYRVYTVCERKKWADEALAYNGLVIAWPELSKLSLAQRAGPKATQATLDLQS